MSDTTETASSTMPLLHHTASSTSPHTAAARVNSLVPPVLYSTRSKRKLSIASSCDEEYEPGTDEAGLGESVDDESSIQCDEDEKDEDEIDDLKKEGEIPIEELMVMYGLHNSHEYMKLKVEDSQDSGSDADSTDLERRMTMYDKDDWKKEICVGPDFQAEIPPLLEKDKVVEEEEVEKDTLLWRPDKLNSDELNKYLSKVYSLDEMPIAEPHRDDEEALFILHSHGYKVESALELAEKHMSAKNGVTVQQTMTPWTEEECQGFESGLKIYGKQFHLIQKNLVPGRSISEIVQFYYLWKKTERYDIFIQYYRLGSTRFIFNPGQPLDMDRSAYLCRNTEEEDGSRLQGDVMHHPGIREDTVQKIRESALEHSPNNLRLGAQEESMDEIGPIIHP